MRASAARKGGEEGDAVAVLQIERTAGRNDLVIDGEAEARIAEMSRRVHLLGEMRHEVAARRMQRKTFATKVGPITLDCEVLATYDGQNLVVLTPPAGSSALDDLHLLRVLGDQAVDSH